GTSATAQNLSHTYAAAGSYTVALTVSDNQGATGSTSQTVTVTQPNQPPTASASGDCNVLSGLLSSRSAASSDTVTADHWPSSSGNKSSQGTISGSHTYLLGSYTIRVTVTDSHGASGWDAKVLTVLINLGNLGL